MKNLLQKCKAGFRSNSPNRIAPPKAGALQKSIFKTAIMAGLFMLINVGSAFASHFNFGPASAEMQTASDQADVLQKCLDLAALQNLYPKNADGTYKQLTVMQHGVAFQMSIGVTHGGQSVSFMDKAQVNSSNLDAYFYFHEFQLDQNVAKVDFIFHYDQLSGSPKMQVVSVELVKSATGWNIVQSKLEAR
jgi:hypothetical protein